jgi:hypothetical protein
MLPILKTLITDSTFRKLVNRHFEEKKIATYRPTLKNAGREHQTKICLMIASADLTCTPNIFSHEIKRGGIVPQRL